MDFSYKTYKNFLQVLKTKGFSFDTFTGYLQRKAGNEPKQQVILRHDVDRLASNALKMAKLENELGIQSSYYFRAVSDIFKAEIMEQIADLGHEIGYHYEDLSLYDGDIDKAYDSFCQNLEEFRKIYPVKTICMHGNPKSKYDSKEIWKKYDYRKLDIIGEPYFDIDFNQVLYLTDTGRRWDGWKVSMRDKVPEQQQWINRGMTFHSTQEIIEAAQKNQLPDKIMLTTHPQRWTNKPWPWMKELVWQNLKNIVKYILVKNQH